MGRKAKFSFEVKMDIVQRCLAGKTTAKSLRAEKERAEMEASFLKKLEEIERRRY